MPDPSLTTAPHPPTPFAMTAIRALALALALYTGSAYPADGSLPEPPADNSGWRSLFDGKTLDGWRGFKTETPPAGWRIEAGALFRDGSGGDLLTIEQFGDFELRLQWKIAEGGNSGVLFHVVPLGSQIWETGPEVQVLDNARHDDGRNPLTSAGANYALHAPTRDVTRPVGAWNDLRLLVQGSHVEHWLNGEKIVEYELWSPDWERRVAASKFAAMPRYGRERRGHIALQDHGDRVWFRDIQIKEGLNKFFLD